METTDPEVLCLERKQATSIRTELGARDGAGQAACGEPADSETAGILYVRCGFNKHHTAKSVFYAAREHKLKQKKRKKENIISVLTGNYK